MNYDRPTLLEALASAYVLGSLRGPARTRYERLCGTLAAARAARQRWEDRLLPLALIGDEVQPRADSWTGIARRLATLDQRPVGNGQRGLPGWRWLAAASVAVIVLMIGMFALRQQPQWQLVADIAPPNAATQWRVQRSADAQRLSIQTLRQVSHAPTTSFELWVLPADGSTPVSLGVIPESGTLERALDARQAQLLLTAMNVAVTVEPAGGSPNGLPSSAPIIVTPIVTSG